MLGQVTINEIINKNLLANDKILGSLNVKIETLSSTLKNQLSFNKMIETQLAQIVAPLLAVENGKIPGQPEAPVENVNMVSTGWGNPSRRSSRINLASRQNPPKNDFWDGLVAAVVRPGAAGLLIGIEYSRVRDSSWMYFTSFVTTRIGVELAAVQRKLPDRLVVGLQLCSARTFHVTLSLPIYKGG